MHDDDFDRGLAQRLRAYESRLPDADAPDPARLRGHRSVAWPLFLTGGAAVVAGALLAVLLLNRPDAPVGEAAPSGSSTATASASPSPVPSASSPSPTPQPTASATPAPSADSAPAPLTWTATGSFEGDGGPSIVNDVAAGSSRLVAVGVAYRADLPGVGPLPPHRARIWTSDDGRSWSELDLGDASENVRLEHLIVRADGSFLALGTRSVADAEGVVTQDAEPVAWSSSDGQEWAESDPPFPRAPAGVAQGSQGYVAHVFPEATAGSRVWYSPDGVAWEEVPALNVDLAELQAGSDGFVAIGRNVGDGELTVLASADGREWVTATDPPAGAAQVAPLGGDWLAVSAFGDAAPNGSVWLSANGLEWHEHGAIGLREPDSSGGSGECGEYPREMSAAGTWLVVSTGLSFPCSEGAFTVYARQWISPDGSTWTELPFEPGTPGEARSGADVTDGVEFQGRLVLVGEEDGQATFWLGEAQ